MDWSFQQCFSFLYAFCSLHETMVWPLSPGRMMVVYSFFIGLFHLCFELVFIDSSGLWYISVCLVFSWLPGTSSMVLNASEAEKNFNLLSLL